MAIAFSVDDGGSINDLIRRLTDLREDELPKAEGRAVEKAALIVLKVATKNIKPGRKGVLNPAFISGRSGKMKQSLAVQPAEKGPFGMQSRVGYREGHVGKYVAVHEADSPTTIRPRRAKVLAIPLPTIMTGAGVPRFQSPRQMKGHWVMSQKGNLVFLPRGGGPPAFVGKKSVTIKPRRPLMKAKETTGAARSRVIRAEIQRAIQMAMRR